MFTQEEFLIALASFGEIIPDSIEYRFYYNDQGKFPWHIEEQDRFCSWLIENNLDPQDTKLSLGYLPIGQLCLYREAGGEMIRMQDLWFGSHADKIDWNRNVWSKYDTVNYLIIEKT